MTVRDRRRAQGTMSSKLKGLASIGAGALLLLSTSVVSADELKILDIEGQTRSAIMLNEGASATVRVSLLKTNTLKTGTPISLVNTKTKQIVQTSSTDSNGVALFKNVSDGTFSVSMTEKGLTIADVQIQLNTSSQTSSDAKKREDSRAMYVAGAGAVAGGIGIALGASNSGGSSNSGDTTTLSGSGETGGLGVSTLGEAAEAGMVAGGQTAGDGGPVADGDFFFTGPLTVIPPVQSVPTPTLPPTTFIGGNDPNNVDNNPPNPGNPVNPPSLSE